MIRQRNVRKKSAARFVTSATDNQKTLVLRMICQTSCRFAFRRNSHRKNMVRAAIALICRKRFQGRFVFFTVSDQ